MKIPATILALLLPAALLAAGQPDVQRPVVSLQGLQAQFTQSYTPKGFRKAQVENGSVVFGNLPLMRWTYASPEKKVFVFDGTTSWFYVPDERQVTVNTLTDQEREALPFLFLNDPAKVARSYAVSERSGRGSVTTTLTARSASLPIAVIAMSWNPSDHLLRRLEYSDRQGNRTVFELSGFTKAAAAPDTFRFEPPPGTEVVKN